MPTGCQGKLLGRKVLRAITTIVTPDTHCSMISHSDMNLHVLELAESSDGLPWPVGTEADYRKGRVVRAHWGLVLRRLPGGVLPGYGCWDLYLLEGVLGGEN